MRLVAVLSAVVAAAVAVQAQGCTACMNALNSCLNDANTAAQAKYCADQFVTDMDICLGNLEMQQNAGLNLQQVKDFVHLCRLQAKDRKAKCEANASP
ncbi:hypothetical protein GQ42DRAFT_160625 [Ramicandelaber brevisporus]|nr:hypothetical protein GQ42DRAFT_160625 [Ramicandelaber brevisporus]